MLAHHVFSKAVAEFVSLGPVYVDDAEGDQSGREARPSTSTADSDDGDSAGEVPAAPQPDETDDTAAAVTPTPTPPAAIDILLAEFMQAVRIAHGGRWCSVEELYRRLNEWLSQRDDTSDVRITCARMLSGIKSLYRPTWERRDGVMKMRVPPQAPVIVQDLRETFLALNEADAHGAGSGIKYLETAHGWAVSIAAVKKAYDAFVMAATPQEARVRTRNAALDDAALIGAGFVLQSGVHCCHACGHKKPPRGAEQCCDAYMHARRVKKRVVMGARLWGQQQGR